MAGWLARWERTQLVTVLRGFVGPHRGPLAPRALWENAAGPGVKKYQNAPQWRKKKKVGEGGEVEVEMEVVGTRTRHHLPASNLERDDLG